MTRHPGDPAIGRAELGRTSGPRLRICDDEILRGISLRLASILDRRRRRPDRDRARGLPNYFGYNVRFAEAWKRDELLI
jgi:hypothetical protein